METAILLGELLKDPGLSADHRAALRYVLNGGAEARAAMLRQGRPLLADELVPVGFAGFPVVAGTELASRMLEVMLLGGCHDNLAAWLGPIGDAGVLAYLERQAEGLELPKAELAAMVIGTLPSMGDVAEEWLWEQRDSVLEAAMRRVRSDAGLRCFFRFALGRERARLDGMARRVLGRPRAFEGRVAVALLAVSDDFAEAVWPSWNALAPAAKVQFGLRFEGGMARPGAFSAEMERTIQSALGEAGFFATAQAGWVAGVAVKRYGERFREEILRGMRGSGQRVAVIRGMGTLGREAVDGKTARVCGEMLEMVREEFAGDAEVGEAVAGALESLRGFV